MDSEKVSQLESKDRIEFDILEQIAKILNVTPEAIQRFNEEAAINIISSNLYDNAGSVNYNFNRIDKLIEIYEENKKLYEKLLNAEKEKVTYLEQLLNSKN